MFTHFLGGIFGVPQWLGWARGWVRVGAVLWFGVSREVSHGVCQGVSVRVRLAQRLGKGGVLALALGLETRSRCSWAASGKGKRGLWATS